MWFVCYSSLPFSLIPREVAQKGASMCRAPAISRTSSLFWSSTCRNFQKMDFFFPFFRSKCSRFSFLQQKFRRGYSRLHVRGICRRCLVILGAAVRHVRHAAEQARQLHPTIRVRLSSRYNFFQKIFIKVFFIFQKIFFKKFKKNSKKYFFIKKFFKNFIIKNSWF